MLACFENESWNSGGWKSGQKPGIGESDLSWLLLADLGSKERVENNFGFCAAKILLPFPRKFGRERFAT
jgi:hypothetical protein